MIHHLCMRKMKAVNYFVLPIAQPLSRIWDHPMFHFTVIMMMCLLFLLSIEISSQLAVCRLTVPPMEDFHGANWETRTIRIRIMFMRIIMTWNMLRAAEAHYTPAMTVDFSGPMMEV